MTSPFPTTLGGVTELVFHQHLAQYGAPVILASDGALADDETITMIDVDREGSYVTPGQHLEVDQEAMVIIRTHENHVEVRRAQLGTEIATHADLAEIRVSPRFFRQQVFTEIAAELRSWDQQIFPTRTVEVEWAADTTLVDLPDMAGFDPYRVLGATQITGTNDPHWTVSSLSVRPHPDAAFDFQLFSLRQQAATLTVNLATSFNTTTVEYDTTLAAIGIEPQHVEILRLGTAARLIRSAEILRTNTTVQGQPRYAEEVPPQHQQLVAEALTEMRDVAYNKERDRLRMRWGA